MVKRLIGRVVINRYPDHDSGESVAQFLMLRALVACRYSRGGSHHYHGCDSHRNRGHRTGCCLRLLSLIQPIPVRFPDPLPAIPAMAQESVPGDNRQMTDVHHHIVLPGYI